MTQEIWKDVVGYEGLYQISNMGNVRSIDHITNNRFIKGRLLTPRSRQHGYLGIPLYGKGGHPTRNCRTFSVHRLVAEAFLPNPENLAEVNHKNENKQDNRLSNLEWISHRDNTCYGNAQEKKRLTNRERHNKFKPILQYSRSGEFIKRFDCINDANRETGVPAGNIVRCAKGSKSYSHAGGYVWRYES